MIKLEKMVPIWWTPSFRDFLKDLFSNVERVRDKQLLVVEVRMQFQISHQPDFLSSNKNLLERYCM